MGREVRRVPPNWAHPETQDAWGRYGPQPMFDRTYKEARQEWLDGLAAHDPDKCDGADFWEWEGDPPNREYYRPTRLIAQRPDLPHRCLQRHPGVPEVRHDDNPRPFPAKKDRKRWCGGKEGREHRWEPRPPHPALVKYSVIDVCSVCGRKNWITYRRLK